MATNQFVPFSAGLAANVIGQAAYEADPDTGPGYKEGIVRAEKINKVLRQGTFVAAAIGEYIKKVINQDVLDNGDLDAFVAGLEAALKATASRPTALLITGTAALAAGVAGIVYIENATTAAITVTLPPTPGTGQTVKIVDSGGNAALYKITVQGAGGSKIFAATSYEMRVAYQSAEFAWTGSKWVVL